MAQLLSCVAATACALERKSGSESSRLEVFHGLIQESSLRVVQWNLMHNLMHVPVAVTVIVCALVKEIDLPSVPSLRSWPWVDLDPAKPPGPVDQIRVSILVPELVPILWPGDIYLFSAREQEITISRSC